MIKQAVTLSLFLGLIAPSPAQAQGQRGRGHSGKEILILNPAVSDPADATFAVDLGDRVRNRMDFRYRRTIDTHQTQRICEALAASGFACDAALDDIMIAQMAIFLDADGYFVWSVARPGGVPSARIRLVDSGRSGLSGWTTVVGQPGQDVRAFADVVLDSIDTQMDAANNARRCYEDRDSQNYRSASGRARSAFERYPNHPSAASCLATVFEADRAPIDSVIMALEMVVAGDSLLARTWQRLGQSYMQKGDTASAADAFIRVVQANPNDMEMRFAVAVMYQGQGNYQGAKDLLDYAVERNPTDMIALGLRAQVCVEGEFWDCALETLGLVFEADSATHVDETFYQQLFGAAQALQDTAAMLHWSGVAVDFLPESLTLWRARAQSLRDARQDQGALAAYRRISRLDTADIRSTLSAAEIAQARIVVDTSVVLDTSAVLLLDTLLQQTLSRSSDPNVAVTVAVKYLQTGSALARGGHVDPAIDYLEKAIGNAGTQESIVVQSNFWLGIMLFSRVTALDNRVVDQQSCELARQERELVARGRLALETGRSVHQAAEQYLSRYAQYEQRVPTLIEAFCR